MATKEEVKASVEAMRQAFKENDDKRDEGLPLEIPEVIRHNDLSYGPDPKWHLLDLYLPKEKNGKLPTIIAIHGGGWVYGTKETYQFFGLRMAKGGFAFVNFNYRLAPEVVFPQEMDDVDLAIHWVVDHANDYHLDLNNVFIIGDSAGGQMAMQYLTIYTNDSFREKFGYEKPALNIRAAAINCGASFIDSLDVISGAPEAYFTPEAIQKHSDLMKTERYMTKSLPPVFLTTANQDFIRDCTVRLDGYLMAKEIFHEFHSYGDEENPRGHVFNYDMKDPIAEKCNQEILAFFNRYMA